MKFRKTAGIITAAAILALSAPAVAGCNKGNDLADKMFDFGDSYYRSVDERFSLNYDEMVYDDFTEGIDLSRWVISDSVWDQWSTDQNGVRPQNVFLVNDENNPETHLLLRANGSYYNMENDKLYSPEERKAYGDGNNLFTAAQGYGINSGACISSIEAFGPGRYEVKMKACPRIGALTSMWVYSWFTLNDGSTQQNEIDIELGLEPNFSEAFFTTWTAPANNTNMPTPVDFCINDGNWHVYTFDWVVDATVPYVDYYIDGIKLLTIDANVPTTNATLNLGLWCPSWAGGGVNDPAMGGISVESRMFESDFAEISWWRHIPFQMENWEQRPVQNRNYADGYVPKTLTSVPNVNKCSNGDFESTDEDYLVSGQSYGYGNPWRDVTIDVEDYSVGIGTEQLDDGTENSFAEIINGGYYGQWLRGASEGFKYQLTGRYRVADGGTAAFGYDYYLGYSVESGFGGSNNPHVIGTATEWTEFTYTFVVTEENVHSILYYLINSAGTGSCFFDDLKLVYLGNQ